MGFSEEEPRSLSRFEIVRPIGQGAMGLVYEAIDRETGTRVALKTLRAPTPEALLLLKSESRQLQDLSHPALVTPHELFEHDGDWFFSMDLIEGTDFLSYVRPKPSDGSDGASAFDERRLRATLAQLVVGLNALHADNKVHRDVKPSNVLVEPDGRTRILDFGIAFNLAAGVNADEDAGALLGTAHYMAPEQAGGEGVTPAADWYAVGAMLYEALTGRPPFDGDLRDIIEQKWAREPVPPQRLNPEVPDDLNQLCADLLRTDPAPRPDGPDLLERLGVLPTSETRVIHRGARLVGRRNEILRMEDGLRAVASGNAVTLLVEGDSGVGKSALVREFVAQAKSKHGARVFHGRCYERESLPFKAVDSVIDELARYLSRLPEGDAAALLPEGAAALRTVFPILQLVPALAGAIPTHLDALDPSEQRARIFTLVRTLFANLAAKTVIVVVIDDLQWADTDSLALLEELFRQPDAPPLLLLASIRSAVESAVNGVRERLSRLPGDVRWLRLAPLANEDARALVRELLGRDAETSQAVDMICAEARGHPLFIEALVRQRGTRPGTTVARLDDALWERISQLSPDARVIVEIVAVAGAPIPQEVVARAAAMDFARVFAPAGTLRSEHLARTSGVYRKDTIEPYHDRVRELVFARLAAPACEWWHGRLALALEDLGYVDPERLLVHWLGAGDAVRAAENAVVAADAASRVFAFDHAASLYRLAIEQAVFSGEALRVLHGKLGDALATSRASASTAPPSVSEGATPGGALILRTRAMEQMVRSGLIDKGLAAIGELAIGVGLRLPSSGRIGLLQLWIWRAFLRLRGLEYRERDPSEIPTRTLERLELSWAIGAALEAIDSVRASVFKSRYIALALGVGARDHVARALAIETVHVAAGGQRSWAKTSRLVARARDLGARIGGPAAALALFTEGFAQHLSGRHSLAVTSLREALSLARDDRSGFNWEVGIAERYLLTSLVWIGRLRELCDEQPRYLRDATDRGDLYTAFALRSGYRSFVHLVNDDPAFALSEIERARREWRRDGYSNERLDILIGTVNARLYLGEARRALSLIGEEWQSITGARLHRAELSRIWLRWDRGRCALAASREDSRDASRLWASAEEDARALATERATWAGALSGLLRAGVASARDRDGERARRLLEAAVAVLEREGMDLHANAARRCLGVLVGGGAGHAMSVAADAWMRGQRIRDPGRMTAMLVPGLP